MRCSVYNIVYATAEIGIKAFGIAKTFAFSYILFVLCHSTHVLAVAAMRQKRNSKMATQQNKCRPGTAFSVPNRVQITGYDGTCVPCPCSSDRQCTIPLVLVSNQRALVIKRLNATAYMRFDIDRGHFFKRWKCAARRVARIDERSNGNNIVGLYAELGVTCTCRSCVLVENRSKYNNERIVVPSGNAVFTFWPRGARAQDPRTNGD